MIKKEIDINHTRLNRTTNIVEISNDKYNPMSLVVEFEYTPPTNYYIEEQNLIYGLYLDRELIKEFREKLVKFQMPVMYVNSVLEIFVHPHGGFKFIRERLVPGNKIRIRFRAKEPVLNDIEKHYVYWDNVTGTYLTAIMGQIDADDGSVQGRYLKSGEII